jgi:hypothetical protein
MCSMGNVLNLFCAWPAADCLIGCEPGVLYGKIPKDACLQRKFGKIKAFLHAFVSTNTKISYSSCTFWYIFHNISSSF